jgi:dipeptidyl aminopeptidase/acylaminoacyl peptidase
MRRTVSVALGRLAAAVFIVAACVTWAPSFASEPSAGGGASPRSASTAKIPLDYPEYDRWNAIRGTRLSRDGAWLAYALVPGDGDPTLVVREFAKSTDVREDNGLDPAFTADSAYVVYTVRAKNDDIRKAEREHKKPEDSPKNGAAILELASGTVTKFGRVKSYAVAPDPGNATVVLLDEPSPKPSGGASAPAAAPSSASTSAPASPSAAPSLASPSPTPAAATPSAAPSPKASPDDLHKIDDGTDLTIRDLTHRLAFTAHRVTSYALSHDGTFVAYATASKDGKNDGLYLYDVVSAKERVVATGEGHYRNLAFAPKGLRLAYESDAATFAQLAPTYALFTLDPRTFAAGEKLAPIADAASTGLARGFAPSANATPSFSQDGRRLYFGTAAAPTPVPSGTPEPMKVDIWTWRDPVLQSQQRKDADRERKRTYLAVADVTTNSIAQLGAPDLRDVIPPRDTATVALGLDDRAYRKATSWLGNDAADVYAISLATGARTLLARNVAYAAPSGGFARGDALSPHGTYFASYDPAARAWFAIDTHARRRVDLTSRLHVPFYDELDDHPAPPPPYAFGGWLDGERAALVLDRYDVWAIDPRSASARDLTGGYGRAHHLRFAPVQLDPDATSFDSTRPLVLSAFDDASKDSGYYVLDPGAREPRKLWLAPKAISGLIEARDSARVVAFAQRFDEARNLWTAPSLSIGATFARASDANPQMANYRWGHAHLISYTSTWGKPLRGIVLVPDSYDRTKKLPMLVYFYERFSDQLHAPPFTTPAPGTSPTLVRYVSHGYVVFLPDVAYRNGHPGQSALGSILPGVDAVVREGLVDPARIGIAGHSWAAYQIQYMITQTNRFRAAEAGAAVTNMTSAYGGIRLESGVVREAQYETGQSRIGATPWDRPDLYLENSALFHIKNVHTPYLTIANDLDGAVPFLQGVEWITAMRRLGKEAYLFSFDGEEHNLVGREQQKYWTVHLDEFFDHFLQGAPTPTWMTSGVDFLHRGERPVRALYGETP